MIILNVPFEEKDEAKKLGAIWDPEIKKWIAKDRRKYKQLSKWFPGEFVRGNAVDSGYKVVYNYLYIIEAKHKCWKCGKDSTVISFGVKNFYDNILIGKIGRAHV